MKPVLFKNVDFPLVFGLSLHKDPKKVTFSRLPDFRGKQYQVTGRAVQLPGARVHCKTPDIPTRGTGVFREINSCSKGLG